MFIKHKNQLINITQVHDIRLSTSGTGGMIHFYFSEEEETAIKFDSMDLAQKAFDSLSNFVLFNDGGSLILGGE